MTKIFICTSAVIFFYCFNIESLKSKDIFYHSSASFSKKNTNFFDSRNFNLHLTINNLRSLRNLQPNVIYKTIDNGGGNWRYDFKDKKSADNTGTILITAAGQRLKRIFDSSKGVNIEWFGGAGDGKTDNGPAFEKAKAALPNGGIINFGEGTYTNHNTWMVNKSDISIKGAGVDKTILTADTSVKLTFAVCPIRETEGLFVQGLRGDEKEMFPFVNTTKKGDDFIEMKDASWANEFPVGQEIFIRGGASYYDQEFGELNMVIKKEGARLFLQYPLSRDYSYEKENWEGTLTGTFNPPAVGQSAEVQMTRPPKRIRAPYSIGNDIYTLMEVKPNAAVFKNPGRKNGTATFPAGTYVTKGRQIIRSFHTRNFSMADLTILGKQNRVLTADNSMHTYIRNCKILREPLVIEKGGYNFTIDCARDVTFDNVIFSAPDNNPSTAQISRSSGDVTFKHCVFKNVPNDFSEFCFHVLVDSCSYDIKGRQFAVRLGKSTTYCKLMHSSITMEGGMTAISMDDIQGYKNSQREGALIDQCTFNLNNVGTVLQNMGGGTNEFTNNIITGSFHSFCNSLRTIQKVGADDFLNKLIIKNNKVNANVLGFLFNAGNADIENNEFTYIGNSTSSATAGVIILKTQDVKENDIKDFNLKNNKFKNWPAKQNNIQINGLTNKTAIQIAGNNIN